jgi:hypothetical protein
MTLGLIVPTFRCLDHFHLLAGLSSTVKNIFLQNYFLSSRLFSEEFLITLLGQIVLFLL